MFADDAAIECSCGTLKIITGKDCIRTYWIQRLDDYPAFDLSDLRPYVDGAVVAYIAPNGTVEATLGFDAARQIRHLRCGPASGF